MYRFKRYPHLYRYQLHSRSRYGFRITRQVNGVRTEIKHRGYPDLSSALRAYRKNLVRPRKSPTKMFGSWARQLITVRRPQWKASTANNFTRICRHDLRQLDHIPLTKITPLIYQKRVINPLLAKGFRHSSLSTVQSVASEIFNAAVREHLIGSNPLRGLRLSLGRPRRQKTLMSKPQFRQFLSGLRSVSWTSHFLFTLLGLTGMRMGEALALKWNDFTPDYQSLHIRATRDSNGRRPPKTVHSRRTLSLPKQLQSLARAYRKHQHPNPDHYVITNVSGKPLTSGDVSRRLYRCLEATGLAALRGRFTAHTFRHQFASYMIANGAPIADVSKALGHANPAVTLRIYTQVVPRRRSGNLSQAFLDDLQSGPHRP